MTSTPCSTSPVGVHAPYRVAPDTYVIPELVAGPPGTYVPLNSMVITGAEPVIVDTGNELSRDEWMSAAFSVVDPADVRWIFLSHDDHDHIGNLTAVLDACPKATLVTNWFTVERTHPAMELPLDRMRWVNPGESFDAGDRTFVAVRPPIFDSPTTRGLYDTRPASTGRSDCFASLLPGHVTESDDAPDDLWRDSFTFFAQMVSPWVLLTDPVRFVATVEEIARLDITAVAGGHMARLQGDRFHESLDLLRELPSRRAPRCRGRPTSTPCCSPPRPTATTPTPSTQTTTLRWSASGREASAMEIGLAIAQIGHFADPHHVVAMAVGAEARGYASLWALDRLLAPVAPRSAYPGNPEGLLPAAMAVALDPLVTLATVAASTTTIRLGTNVLVAPWYRPALLARSLASLDVMSRGRLDVGLGLGWSADEYDAVGVPQRELASRAGRPPRRARGAVAAGRRSRRLRGPRLPIGPSSFRPRPVQRPRPPILLAAYTPAGLERVGRRANGWTPAGLDIPTTAAMWGVVVATAEAAGRDPDQLSMVVRANVHHSLVPLGADRPTYHGSVDQIAADVRGAFEIGARQVILDLQSSTSEVEEYLDLADAITVAARVRAGGVTEHPTARKATNP